MPAITSLDLSNAKLDVDHIAAIATSLQPTATDRLGHTKDTISGAVYKIASFTNKGVWAPSTDYQVKDLVSVTVSSVTTWYVCVVQHTSSSSFSTDSSSKWRIYQGVTTGDLSASSGSNLVGYVLDSIGGVYRTIKSKLQGYVDVYDFGVVGDGVVDDTINMQKALDHGALKNLIVHGLSAIVKITAPLTINGPGLVFDKVSYGASGDPGILVSGTGYTAITVSPGIHTNMAFTVYGTGNTANGVLIQNSILSKFDMIRVYNLDGFGVKINKMWDSVILSISVELCGNALEYAFSMNDDGDTCNMTHIMRLQVERSNTKAIYISPLSLSCVIDNIHSEQANPVLGVYTWVLGGNRCVYNSVRLNANTSANASVLLSASNTQYNSPLFEGAIVATADAFGSSSITIISPEVIGTIGAKIDQTGVINITGGVLANLSSQASTFVCTGVKILNLTVGFASNVPDRMRFYACNIGTLNSSSNTSAATFNDCTIAEAGSYLPGKVVFNGCTINTAGAVSIAFNQQVDANYSTITATGGFSCAGNAKIRSIGSRFIGDMSFSAQFSSIFDSGSSVSGTVSGFTYPSTGAWVRGDRTKNITPAVGSAKAWVCTASGSPGTWMSEGNL